jgi:hypothetical protein
MKDHVIKGGSLSGIHALRDTSASYRSNEPPTRGFSVRCSTKMDVL